MQVVPCQTDSVLTIQQLRVLTAVADHGSLARAAEALNYGTPTVTHHLNALERELEVQLVERTPRGVRLTEMGNVVLQEAQGILGRTQHLHKSVAQLKDAGVSTLRIGTFASSGSRLLPPAIRELQSQFEVQVEVIEAEPTTVVSMLQRQEIHAGLIYDFSDDPSFSATGLHLTHLQREPYQVLIAKNHPLAQRSQLDFTQLRDVSWICARHEDESPGRALQRACRGAGFIPKELIRTDDLLMIHGLVAEGLGMAVITESATVPQLGVTLRPAVQPLGERLVALASTPGRTPPAVHELARILTQLSAR